MTSRCQLERKYLCIASMARLRSCRHNLCQMLEPPRKVLQTSTSDHQVLKIPALYNTQSMEKYGNDISGATSTHRCAGNSGHFCDRCPSTSDSHSHASHSHFNCAIRSVHENASSRPSFPCPLHRQGESWRRPT